MVIFKTQSNHNRRTINSTNLRIISLIRYFIEVNFVVWKVSSHNSIPEVEVETVGAVEFLVVKIMVSRRADPFEKPMAGKTFWHKFIARMPPDI